MHFLRRVWSYLDSFQGRRLTLLAVAMSFFLGHLAFRWLLVFGSPEDHQRFLAMVGGQYGAMTILLGIYGASALLVAVLGYRLLEANWRLGSPAPAPPSPSGRGGGTTTVDSPKVVSIKDGKKSSPQKIIYHRVA